MSATFGKLDQKTLELGGGLNILQAPNETGKSTWCAFLLAMLYGINSRERDRVGFIADKNRYAPWSGFSMTGRMDCTTDGNDLTLLRETKRPAAPLGEFKAVYTGTGEPFPGLTGQNCGETLLGVSREVYERSAFIRQTGLAITQDAGLEKRISSLITTGQEDISFSEAAETLKKQLNRRRHNKTGQLPALESELAETARQLEQLDELDAQLLDVRSRIRALSEEEAAQKAQLSLHDRWEASQIRQAADACQAAAREAEDAYSALLSQAEAEHLPENEEISRLRGAIVNLETVRRSVDKAMAEKDAAMKAAVKAETAVSESPLVGQTAESAGKAAANVPGIRKKQWWLPLTLLAVGAGGAFLLRTLSENSYPLWVVGIIGAAGLLAGVLAMLNRERADRKKQDGYLASYGVTSAEALSALADAYIALCRARDEAQSAVAKTTGVYEGLYASLTSNEQGILMEVRRFAPDAFDIPAADAALRERAVRRKQLSAARTAAESAKLRWEVQRQQLSESAAPAGSGPSAPPERSRAELESALRDAAAALEAARSAADRICGQIAAVGDRAALEARQEQLAQHIETLEEEYQSLLLAAQTLEEANGTLQTRFSPELGRRTAALFSELTGGAYRGVTLDRSFHLAAEPTGDTVYRDAQLLSLGASDQLYLAARLAICELVLPSDAPPPLVLDDALASFDDDRCAAALRWLAREGEKRQILLFTCHSREAAYFQGSGEVSVQRLTDGQAGV